MANSSYSGVPDAPTPEEARWKDGIRPVRKRSRKSTNFKKWVLRSIPLMLTIAVIASCTGGFQARNAANDAQQRFDESYNPAFKVRYADLGRQVLLNWYNQDQPVVDIAADIQWPGDELSQGQGVAQSSQDQSGSKSSRIIPDLKHITFLEGQQASRSLDPTITDRYPQYKNPYEESNTYYVVMNNQAVTVTVTFVIPDLEDTSIPPILVSPPVIDSSDKVGNTRSEISSDPVGNENLVEGETTADIENMVRLWAESWASNDSVSLKSITNDNSDKTYYGLGGWQVDPSSVRIVWSYAKRNPEDEEDKSTMVMEVEYNIFQQNKDDKGTSNSSSSSSDGGSGGGSSGSSSKPNPSTQFSNVQTFNLLVENADTGRPSIVAWGPSGSWSSLVPYQNGMDAEERDLRGQGQDNKGSSSSTDENNFVEGNSGGSSSGQGGSSQNSDSGSNPGANAVPGGAAGSPPPEGDQPAEGENVMPGEPARPEENGDGN